MSNTIQFTCSCCGQLQNEWPALTFKAPYHYAGMSEADKASRGELDTDFCVIRHDDQVDRFIRVTLTQKVIGGCQHLNYGVWVSLSEASFQDYADRFGDETQDGGVQYFGWLCNDIPGYQFDESIPMASGQRQETIVRRLSQRKIWIILLFMITTMVLRKRKPYSGSRRCWRRFPLNSWLLLRRSPGGSYGDY